MYLYITVVIVMHSCCGYFICEIRLWWSSCWWQWHVCTLCIFCFFHRTVHSEKGRKESTEWQIIDMHTFFVCKYNRISSDAATAMPQICCSAPAFFRNRIVQETCVMYVCVCVAAAVDVIRLGNVRVCALLLLVVCIRHLLSKKKLYCK